VRSGVCWERRGDGCERDGGGVRGRREGGGIWDNRGESEVKGEILVAWGRGESSS